MDEIEIIPLVPGPSALAWLRLVVLSAIVIIACFVVLSILAGMSPTGSAHQSLTAWRAAIGDVFGISAVVLAVTVLCTIARSTVERRSDYTSLPFLGREFDCVDPRTGAILRDGGQPALRIGQYLAARAAARAHRSD